MITMVGQTTTILMGVMRKNVKYKEMTEIKTY